MNPENPDIFDEIAAYVPEPHRQAYWRMVSKFRQLKPDDEILNIILAMGILTFLLRDLPAALIREKKGWQTQLGQVHAEIRNLVEGATRQMVTVTNQGEAMNQALERTGALFKEGASQIEKASRETVKQIDIDEMAQRLTARVEERVVTRFEALVTTMEKRFDLMERIGAEVLRLIEHLREIHMGRMIAAISAVVLVICGGAFLAAYWHLQDIDKAALDDKLAQVEQMATANQKAFAALADNNITVDVTDVVGNGQKVLGQKALVLSPALDTRIETRDSESKAGVIYFSVTPTLQDQMEHNREEIDRVLHQFPTK